MEPPMPELAGWQGRALLDDGVLIPAEVETAK